MPKVKYIYGKQGSGRSTELLKLRHAGSRQDYIVTDTDISAKYLREIADDIGVFSGNIISFNELRKQLPYIYPNATLYFDDMESCFILLLKYYGSPVCGAINIPIPNLCCTITQTTSDLHIENFGAVKPMENLEITEETEIELDSGPTVHISSDNVTVNIYNGKERAYE